MKTVAPDYYPLFKCSAGSCRHTCCQGWEIDIDSESLSRFEKVPDIAAKIEYGDTAHFRLMPGDRCPFLQEDGLCSMIIRYGEDMLCGICTDHPRFRNYFSDRVELGLGLVCEEAAKLILSRDKAMELITLQDDGVSEPLPDDEMYLIELREELMEQIQDEGPQARLMEYLLYRHLPDALYDGMLQQRIDFINSAYCVITDKWMNSGNTIDELAEICRCFSYDVEYDDEVLEESIRLGKVKI